MIRELNNSKINDELESIQPVKLKKPRKMRKGISVMNLISTQTKVKKQRNIDQSKKIFHCQFHNCHKSYTVKSSLNRHLRTHYDINPIDLCCVISNCRWQAKDFVKIYFIYNFKFLINFIFF